eukprot:TRINITY_DN2694_c0_g1_i4.p1 TRINITY_DN2694_c0_g1~~TRINITY_DN2694_c0_g1_i4.p1  ORF type:complete len:172 (-),score=58.30 TRINITY_DN2694_c0_g1_i4:329-844(-)
MVLFRLEFKADLENITNIQLSNDFEFVIKVQCSNCYQETDSFIYVSDSEEREGRRNGTRGRGGSGGPTTSDFTMRCKGCRRENSIDIIRDHKDIQLYTIENCSNFVPIAVLDCRGLQPTVFQPTSGFIGESISCSKKFEIDLSEGDFCEYDQDSNESLTIFNAQGRFVRTR